MGGGGRICLLQLYSTAVKLKYQEKEICRATREHWDQEVDEKVEAGKKAAPLRDRQWSTHPAITQDALSWRQAFWQTGSRYPVTEGLSLEEATLKVKTGLSKCTLQPHVIHQFDSLTLDFRSYRWALMSPRTAPCNDLMQLACGTHDEDSFKPR